LTSDYNKNYERLEFLGDSILNFIVTKILLDDNKQNKEGELSKKRSKIVNFRALSKASKKIHLHKYIKTGKSITLINDKILSDCYESLIGAIFIDSNLGNTENFIKNTLLDNIKSYETEMNYKGSLIEFCLKRKESTPIFKTSYLDKEKTFKTKIQIKSMQIECSSTGKNKKDSEKKCSKIALEKMTNYVKKY